MEKPIWSPGPERIERANLSRFMRFCREEAGNADLNSYAPLWQFSVDHPDRFWTLLWDFCGIKASGAREPAFVAGDGPATGGWFPHIRLNFAQNLLRFDDDRAALLQHGADGSTQRTSYSELRARVAELTAALKADGVAAGDCVVAALHNTPDALVAMLAATSLGATWSCCGAEISATAFVERFGRLRPKAVFLAASRAELASALPEAARVVLVPNGVQATTPAGSRRITALADFTADHAGAAPEFVPTAFEHPLYVTESSHPSHPPIHGAGGTLIQHFKELVLHLDMKREDKVLVIGDCGSHAWRWAASSLAVGATLLLQPPPRSESAVAALWDLIDACGVTVVIGDTDWLADSRRLGVHPRSSHKLLALKTIVCTGRPPAAALVDYVYAEVKDRLLLLPAPSAAGQIGCFAIGAPLLPVHREMPLHRPLGMRSVVLDETGTPVVDAVGELACTLPFPSTPIALHDDPDGTRYTASLRGSRYVGSGLRMQISDDGLLQPPGDEPGTPPRVGRARIASPIA